MFQFGIGFNDLVHVRSKTNTYEFAFIIDETIIHIGNKHFWLWICIEPIHRCACNLHFRKKKHVCSRELYSFFG